MWLVLALTGYLASPAVTQHTPDRPVDPEVAAYEEFKDNWSTFAVALTCPVTITINNTPTWTKLDATARAGAKVRCGFLYRKSPCLVKFIKVAELQHQAVCGAATRTPSGGGGAPKRGQ